MVIQYLREEKGILKAPYAISACASPTTNGGDCRSSGASGSSASGARCGACHAGHDSPPASYPTRGYTRIQGALKNLSDRVARSTVATILEQHVKTVAPASLPAVGKVERLFAWLQNFRPIVVRYERVAENFSACCALPAASLSCGVYEMASSR